MTDFLLFMKFGASPYKRIVLEMSADDMLLPGERFEISMCLAILSFFSLMTSVHVSANGLSVSVGLTTKKI